MTSKDPLIITNKDAMRRWSRDRRAEGKVIGLVPTMGYLHEGHLSLVRDAHKHATSIVVSIYVNPGQFSPNEDLSTYPSDFFGDIEKIKSIPGGVDAVFHPYNLYDYGKGLVECRNEEGKAPAPAPADGAGLSCIESSGIGHETWVRIERLEKGLCGKSRPIFFRGIATVVTKLFNIVEPDIAVFGKKDYQQWRIIQRLVRDLDFGIEVIGSELVREDDGLAMSSRNVRLSPEERNKALSISRSLSEAKVAVEKGQDNPTELRNLVVHAIQEAGGTVDYAEASSVFPVSSSSGSRIDIIVNMKTNSFSLSHSYFYQQIVDHESLEAVEKIRSHVVFCVAAWFGRVRLVDNMEIYPKN